MMKNIISIFKNVVPALLLAGCAVSNPLGDVESARLPEESVPSAVVKQRLAKLQKILRKFPVRGGGITKLSYQELNVPPEIVVSRIKEVGFNRIYCLLTSEQELDDSFTGLLKAAAREKLPVEIVLRPRDFHQRRIRGGVLRHIRQNAPDVAKLARHIRKYNSNLPEGVRIAGVTAVFEPHYFTAANEADSIPGMLYLWSDKTFGKGLDNDRLVLVLFRLFGEMQKELKGIPFTVALPDFYHEWAAAGKISKGKVQDFSGFQNLMIISSGNKPSELYAGIRNELAVRKDMLFTVKIAGHSSVDAGALRRRDWNDLLRGLNAFVSSGGNRRCRGLVLFPLAELYYMVHEQD